MARCGDYVRECLEDYRRSTNWFYCVLVSLLFSRRIEARHKCVPVWTQKTSLLWVVSSATVGEAQVRQTDVLVLRPHQVDIQTQSRARFRTDAGQTPWSAECVHLDCSLVYVTRSPLILTLAHSPSAMWSRLPLRHWATLLWRPGFWLMSSSICAKV